jgi:hypothetical protein
MFYGNALAVIPYPEAEITVPSKAQSRMLMVMGVVLGVNVIEVRINNGYIL